MTRLRILSLSFAASLLTGGCSMKELLKRPAAKNEKHDVDFQTVFAFAERANAAYLGRGQIQARYSGRRVHVRDLSSSDVRYFVVFDDAARTQDIAVRGTSNLTNIRVDVEVTPNPDPRLGIRLHEGFAEAGAELFRSVRPFLKRNYKTTITGHSLGGALAAILGMHLRSAGFRVERIITFGQPKVTNLDGARSYADLPVLRVVNRGDPVAEVPPLLSLRDPTWRYTHVGPEVVLWTGNRYIFVEEHQALVTAVLSFWMNLGSHDVNEHKMDAYLASLEKKLDQAEEIRFEDRERYVE